MKLRIANHETFGNVRYTIHNGELMFAGSDIVKGLKLTNNTMLIDCVEPDDKCELEVNEKETERTVSTLMINPCGLQSLISSCRMNIKSDAREYKRWLIKDIGIKAIKELELSSTDKSILDAIHKAYSKPEVKASTPEPIKKVTLKTEEKLYSRREIPELLGTTRNTLQRCLTDNLKWVSPYGNLYADVENKGYAVREGGTSNIFKFTESGLNEIKKALGFDDECNSFIGKRFGKLTVLMKADGNKWFCECDCGNTSTPTKGNLINGNSKSCGKCSRGIN